ncbi:MAG: signal peptidase II, partial [Clostridia bacterium]|nr:signal peptidase II [Clostridia bacterium]
MATIFILVGVVAGVVGLDQLTKYLALTHLDEATSVPWIRGVVHFMLVRNEGAAFGMFSDHRWVFMVFSSVAIVGLGVYLFRFCIAEPVSQADTVADPKIKLFRILLGMPCLRIVKEFRFIA